MIGPHIYMSFGSGPKQILLEGIQTGSRVSCVDDELLVISVLASSTLHIRQALPCATAAGNASHHYPPLCLQTPPRSPA